MYFLLEQILCFLQSYGFLAVLSLNVIQPLLYYLLCSGNLGAVEEVRDSLNFVDHLLGEDVGDQIGEEHHEEAATA